MRLFLVKKSLNKALATLLTGAFFLAGCSGGGIPLIGPTATPTPEPTPTAVPIKTLVICLGQEPSSLYLYGDSSQSAWSIFESLYDGPIDTINYQPQPVILENIPTEENGGITLQSVSVSEGDIVANSEGDLVALK